MSACSNITHLQLDVCFARGLITDKSIKMIPTLLPKLKALRLKHVRKLSKDTFSEFSSLRNLQNVQLERCGSIPISDLSDCCSLDVHLVIDPCPDVPKVFEDSLCIANQNPHKIFSIKVMSTEDFQVQGKTAEKS